MPAWVSSKWKSTVEAKRAGLGHTSGLGQAKDYSGRLKARFAYATNGLGWYEADMHSGKEGDFQPFPTPDDLWQRCFAIQSQWRNRFGAVPFETAGGKWELRYYQHNAINAALEAIGAGKTRILLTLATGHGKDRHRLPDRLEAVPCPLEPLRRTDAPPAHPVPR